MRIDHLIDGKPRTGDRRFESLDPATQEVLAEVARVVKPGGWFYVSEPIYGGALNQIVRLYNDEGTVRAAAQAALDRALAAFYAGHNPGVTAPEASAPMVSGFCSGSINTIDSRSTASTLRRMVA